MNQELWINNSPTPNSTQLTLQVCGDLSFPVRNTVNGAKASGSGVEGLGGKISSTLFSKWETMNLIDKRQIDKVKRNIRLSIFFTCTGVHKKEVTKRSN